jgi:hypothetical protein
MELIIFGSIVLIVIIVCGNKLDSITKKSKW